MRKALAVLPWRAATGLATAAALVLIACYSGIECRLCAICRWPEGRDRFACARY